MKTVLPMMLMAWLLMTCSPRMASHSSGPSVAAQSAPPVTQRPGWVVNKPVKAGYYLGLGSAKTSQSDYHRIAKDKALEDMLTEISVTIHSTSFLYQSAFGKQFSERYEAFIKTSSLEELSAFEPLYSWTGDNEYWVAYGISKSRYHELKAQKIEAALTMALGHLKAAKADEDEGRFLTAIHQYMKTIDALKAYLNEPLMTTIEEEEQVIVTYCRNAIQAILNDLKIGEEQIAFSPVKRMPGTATLYCRGLAVRGFRLNGFGRQFISNQKGQIFIEMDALKGSRIVTLTASKEMLSTFGGENFIADELINSLHFPVFNIPVTVTPVMFYIMEELPHQHTGNHWVSLKPELVNAISAHGFGLSENPQNADFSVAGKVIIREGPETNGLYVCWADLEVFFYNSSDNLVYGDQLAGIKGIHSSYDAAAITAVENLARLLEEKMIQPFIKKVF